MTASDISPTASVHVAPARVNRHSHNDGHSHDNTHANDTGASASAGLCARQAKPNSAQRIRPCMPQIALWPHAVAQALVGGIVVAMAAPSAFAADIERIEVRYHQAYRGNVSDAQLPQAISYIDQAAMGRWQLTRFQDALDSSASIARQNNGGGLWDSFSLRGFPGNENMPSGYLVNGFHAGRGFSGHRDVVNIDSIELRKGPGSALFGRGEPGGTVNLITKKPQFSPEGYVKVMAGRFDQYRLEADMTDALSSQLAFRINGAVQQFNSFRDEVFSDKQLVNPSLLWQIDADSSLLYEFEYLQHEQLFDRGYLVLNNNFATVPRSRYLGEPGDGATEIGALGHQLSYQRTLNSAWQFNAGLSRRTSDLRGFSSDAELASARQGVSLTNPQLTRQRRYRDYQSTDTTVRAEVSGDVALAGLTHHLLMGADAYDYALYTYLGRYRGAKGSYALDIFAPVYGVAVAGAVNALYANDETQQAYGLYLQDVIDLSSSTNLLLGARLDRYQQQILETVKNTRSNANDTRVSPRLGVVHQLTPSLSLYASYSQGFVPLSGTDYAGQAFEPEQSHSNEVGVRWQQATGQATIALFDATKSNILTSDPVHVGFSAALGKANSRGVEIDVSQQLPWDLTLDLSYAWLDTHTLLDAVNPDWGTLVPAGSDLVNVPKHTFALSVRQAAQLAGYGVEWGARLRGQSQRLGDTVNPAYQLPGYAVVSVFAQLELSKQWRLDVLLDNLTDKHYVLNSYSPLWTVPAEPMSYKVSVRYDF